MTIKSSMMQLPVSSEISHLRNFWLHAMCACTKQRRIFIFGVLDDFKLRALLSDGFTHGQNRPWPRAPRNSSLWRLNIYYKFAKLRRGTPDSHQYSKHKTKLRIWAWERFRLSVWKRLQKRMEGGRGLVYSFAVVKVSYMRTTSPYFDNLEFDIFDAGGPQCHLITSVTTAVRI